MLGSVAPAGTLHQPPCSGPSSRQTLTPQLACLTGVEKMSGSGSAAGGTGMSGRCTGSGAVAARGGTQEGQRWIQGAHGWLLVFSFSSLPLYTERRSTVGDAHPEAQSAAAYPGQRTARCSGDCTLRRPAAGSGTPRQPVAGPPGPAAAPAVGPWQLGGPPAISRRWGEWCNARSPSGCGAGGGGRDRPAVRAARLAQLAFRWRGELTSGGCRAGGERPASSQVLAPPAFVADAALTTQTAPHRAPAAAGCPAGGGSRGCRVECEPGSGPWPIRKFYERSSKD